MMRFVDWMMFFVMCLETETRSARSKLVATELDYEEEDGIVGANDGVDQGQVNVQGLVDTEIGEKEMTTQGRRG